VDLELTDKVAVVTGASKGIGFAVVQELAAEGAKVVAGARHLESLADIGGVTPLAVDLADAGGPAELVGYAVDQLGRVDVLVNNVGAVHVRLDGASMPTGKFTTPREVATIVTLLASPRMANVTGANWVIDGGLIKTT
jgi:NAD(P)-dependent dehydrogenase (short-subunit alcohol dehydrogenase family)